MGCCCNRGAWRALVDPPSPRASGQRGSPVHPEFLFVDLIDPCVVRNLVAPAEPLV
ncbi:hypothetical protein I551_1584 [Mycobacterium ulcerans str. Harvey]|uniref:Uncharacterized protein n=1 Tax=Mycobacterium ulcerans str. Harvey TaxID=1299332 RepID=A0ABP3ALN0_MYCUL|nr:hypothetical protein I551_1584 [Mycobacterium ulcerans str. Harvey]